MRKKVNNQKNNVPIGRYVQSEVGICTNNLLSATENKYAINHSKLNNSNVIVIAFAASLINRLEL